MSARPFRLWLALVLIAFSGPSAAVAADPAARGLALQARAALTAQAQLARLQRAAASAAASSPETADPAVGVTVSVATAQDASLTRRYVGATLFATLRGTGGRPVQADNGAWYFPVASTLPATNGNLSGALTATPDR